MFGDTDKSEAESIPEKSPKNPKQTKKNVSVNGDGHGKITFPPFVKDQRSNFNELYILVKEGEEEIEDMFDEREPILVEDIAYYMLTDERNWQNQKNLNEDERTFQFMRTLDKMMTITPSTKLADSISFYKISSDSMIDVYLDSVFNVGIAKPLFVASLVCYESGTCHFDAATVIAEIDGASSTAMQKFADNFFKVKFGKVNASKSNKASEPTSNATSAAGTSMIEPPAHLRGEKPNKIIFVVYRGDYESGTLDLRQIGFSILPLLYNDYIIHG